MWRLSASKSHVSFWKLLFLVLRALSVYRLVKKLHSAPLIKPNKGSSFKIFWMWVLVLLPRPTGGCNESANVKKVEKKCELFRPWGSFRFIIIIRFFKFILYLFIYFSKFVRVWPCCPHSRSVGGGNAPGSCLPTAIISEKEEEEEFTQTGCDCSNSG